MEQQPEQPKQNRARERIQKRRERQQGTPYSASPRRERSQLTPAGESGGFEFPKVDMRYVRPILLGIGAAVFMGLVIFLVGLFKNDPVVPAANALWVGREWTYAANDASRVQAFAANLKDNQIGTVYALISELNFDGTWTGRPNQTNQFSEVQQNVTSFAREFKEAYPNSLLLGTVSVIVNLDEDGYRLDDAVLQQNVADFSARVVNALGYDGVMLDIYPVSSGDDNYLSLVRRVRQTIGDEAVLAVAVPPDWTPIGVEVPTPTVIEPGTVWDREYKQRLVLIKVDQIVVQTYNSYLTRSDEYMDWVAYQVQTFSEAVAALGTDTRVVFGVPTYENALPAHDVGVENLTSAIAGIQRGMVLADQSRSAFQGIAVFAEWETNNEEWDLYKRLWLDQ